ncbi:MAG: transketolase C-terminal domain-containing protein [Spirochaetota bacterium]|nr:transketolase C-terminal domain-containing protein [Spirochaetota bacterium]
MNMTKAKIPTRRAFAERLVEYGEIDKDFVVFESDIGYSTYTYLFGDKYPTRYFNMGIQELNTMDAAAGMSAEGRTVLVAGYGVFLSMRALEAVRSFVCYPNLNVKILSSHGGITPAIDGVTHQASEDMAFLATIPNMKVLAPADTVSSAKCVDIVMQTPGPCFVRLMRDPYFDIYSEDEQFEMGGSKLLREGRDITIATYGDIVFQALEAADTLAKKGIEADVLDLYSFKPLDYAAVRKSIEKTGRLLVAEDHQKRNGMGYELASYCLREFPVPFDHIGLEDTFAESGDYYKLIEKYGLSARHIVDKAQAILKK